MAIYKYPEEVHQFVREHVKGHRNDELARMCNEALGTEFTTSKMRAFCHNHGYTNGMPQGLTREEWRARSKWPAGFYEWMVENSYGIDSKQLSEMVRERFGIDVPPRTIKSYCQRHGIKRGISGWFQKGHEPGTKGKTLEEICKHDPEKLARVRATQFSKGHPPANTLPLGAIVVNSQGYKIRKKSMTGTQWERWEFLHRAMWEEAHGPIPDGMMVLFKDGNKMNCTLDNLMLATRGEHSQLTKWHLRSQDPDLTETGLAVVRLKNAAGKRRKNVRKNGQV